LPRFLFFLNVCLFSPNVMFAAPVSLSLENVIEQGIKSSLELRKSQIDLASAEYSANRLWSEIFPAISGTVGAGYNSRLFSGDSFKSKDNSGNYNLGIGLNFNFNAGIPYSMKNITLAYQIQLLNYDDARNQLEIQITKNFYNLIAEYENIAVLSDILNSAQLLYERNQVAFRNGLINQLTLLQSRLAVENARFSLSVARSNYTNRMDEFLTQLGITYSPETVLEGKIQVVKLELDALQLISEYLPRRPDVLSKRQEIERLENAERQITFSSRAPSLNLSAQWRTTNFSPFTDNLNGSASVSIPIDPWISGTSKYQSIRFAREAIEKARLDLQDTREKAATYIRSLTVNLKNLWDSIEIARLGLEIAELNYTLTEQGFRNGAVDSLKVEDARNNLLDARQRLLQAELSYLLMILDISVALNTNWKEMMQL